jgi:general secretion pathway protein G
MSRFKELKKNRNVQGFTLIEIMIVLAIVGLLFSLVGVKVIDQFKKAKIEASKLQINSYQQALQAYYLAHGTYPHTSQGLDALIHKPSVGKIPENYPDGGYLSKKKLENDPWGHPYRYECEDYQNFSITSDGPDGEPGTDDDIKVE